MGVIVILPLSGILKISEALAGFSDPKGLGSVMSSTGVVAIFVPVVLGIADRLRVPPGRLMMPLSFSALISGMVTLVATPPNLVVDSALRQSGWEGFGLFSFTPFGATILVVGVLYMLVTRNWLEAQADRQPSESPRRSLLDMIRDYGPGQYRFFDFVKVGVPFTVLVMIISVLLVPRLFPLH
jgi:di/tricarboxylate transporter